METSSNHVQEFQFSKYMGNAAEIMNQNSSEYGSKIDHRMSLAWDDAFFTSPGILDPEELFGGLDFRIVPSESLEQEQAKSNHEINTRRSLAWDTAFFTSAGVLDPEELCRVNKGFKKSDIQLIPEVEENIWSPAESNSLINRDFSSLASLEIDLFDDSKSSIHETSKATDVRTSSCKFGEENGLQNTHCLKKSDVSSIVKVKSNLASKRQNVHKGVFERITKATSLPPLAQKVARGGYCSPSSALKPLKASSHVNSPLTTPGKRASSGSNHMKMENKAQKVAPGQQMILSKRPCLEKSSPKSPSLSSHTPFSKSSGLGKAISDSACRFSLNPLRRKIDSRLVSSGSPSPLRNFPGNKFEGLNSSFIDRWFSGSPASINQRSISSTESLERTCKEISSDHDSSKASDSEHHICDRNCFTLGDQDNRPLNQHAKTISVRKSSVLANISSSIKPSGLRMPSSKTGYFDALRSVALTPKRDLKFHSGVHSSSSRTGRGIADHNGAATRTMRSKLQTSGSLSKIDSQKTGEKCHPLGMKKEGVDRLRTTNLEDTKSPLRILADDDKENLCSFHDQVEYLSKHIENIKFSPELEI